MPRRQFTIAEVLTLLAETPRRIRALTTGLTPAELRTAPTRGEWSVNDVLAHLRSCADVRGDVIPTILAERRPTLRAIDPRSWITHTNYLELEFRPSFRAFARQRAELLAVLQPLPRRSWSRSATVTGAGAVLERSVLFYAQWIARHERPHLKQIARIVDSLPSR